MVVGGFPLFQTLFQEVELCKGVAEEWEAEEEWEVAVEWAEAAGVWEVAAAWVAVWAGAPVGTVSAPAAAPRCPTRGACPAFR